MRADDQLSALSHLDELFGQHAIEYWLFGGWAADFHAGKVTRPHDDLDLAVRSHDGERVRELLTAAGWSNSQKEGYSVYELDSVRLELAFVDQRRMAPELVRARRRRGGRGSCACRQPVVVEGRQGDGA